MYYRGSNVALLVYDITERTSFDKVKDWVKELATNCDLSTMIVAVVGNKSDLKDKRQVDIKEAESYTATIESRSSFYIESSAKLNVNISELFLQIVKLLIIQEKETKKHLEEIEDDYFYKDGIAPQNASPQEDVGTCC
eukprot:TRINITY_DN80_c0_g1_i1.p1 TRINITY_DN80_c0_g1~~TRINITY_DN80_c0_g1_i1.p1  ORF type:complete len:138 (+),score=32.75 TRINITY_DN80_c0_g1_i1:362-775(+)